MTTESILRHGVALPRQLKLLVAREFGNVFRLHRVGAIVAAILPNDSFPSTRALLLRSCGWPLGRRVLIASTPRLLRSSGAPLGRLTVGPYTYVNAGAVWDLGAEIRIGEKVHLGPGVALLTTTHELGPSSCRAGGLVSAPIVVGAGSWVGAGAIVLPGSVIGEGSVIAAGCVVRGEVPSNCLFGGVPGRVIRPLESEPDAVSIERRLDVPASLTPEAAGAPRPVPAPPMAEPA